MQKISRLAIQGCGELSNLYNSDLYFYVSNTSVHWIGMRKGTDYQVSLSYIYLTSMLDYTNKRYFQVPFRSTKKRLFEVLFVLIIVVIITWPSEKLHQKMNLTSQLSGPLIISNGLCLCKISSMMSQFSTNKRTFFVFCCFLLAVFNKC